MLAIEFTKPLLKRDLKEHGFNPNLEGQYFRFRPSKMDRTHTPTNSPSLVRQLSLATQCNDRSWDDRGNTYLLGYLEPSWVRITLLYPHKFSVINPRILRYIPTKIHYFPNDFFGMGLS